MRFTTPAFLGNAAQDAQWRTPPFKALLRQWWRVAYAAEYGFRVDLRRMRHEEGVLFGHAWLDDDLDKKGEKIAARKSSVRIRLERWDTGRETKNRWGGEDVRVSHPEVGPVGALLYLGYGPLEAAKLQSSSMTRRHGAFSTTGLKRSAAIQSDESAIISLAIPDEHESHIATAVQLVDKYGALGSRCRNGWGSIVLKPIAGTPAIDTARSISCRFWKDALSLDWPHAVGCDEMMIPLVWKTRSFDAWRPAMHELARIKIGLRTQFAFSSGRNADSPEARHWLSYPVTNHSVRDWGNERLPNSLRFKVRLEADGNFVGVIFHCPCLPPSLIGMDGRPKRAFRANRDQLIPIWQRVHTFLDDPERSLCRIPE